MISGTAFAQSDVSPPRAVSAHDAARQPLPVYFEPLPDGALIGRNLRQKIKVSGREIFVGSGDLSKREPLRIEFVGARRSGAIEGVSEQRGRVNYLVGDRSQWRTGVPIYTRGRTRELYPGIDAEFYASDRHLEYDFVVKTHALQVWVRSAGSAATYEAWTSTGYFTILGF